MPGDDGFPDYGYDLQRQEFTSGLGTAENTSATDGGAAEQMEENEFDILACIDLGRGCRTWTQGEISILNSLRYFSESSE